MAVGPVRLPAVLVRGHAGPIQVRCENVFEGTHSSGGFQRQEDGQAGELVYALPRGLNPCIRTTGRQIRTPVEA